MNEHGMHPPRPDDNKPKPFISLAAAIPITLALLTPLFYLNGKAFHEGYLSHLNLNPTMFAQDSAATMMSAVVAWLSATTSGLTEASIFLNEYWPWALIALLALALAIGTMKWSVKKLANRLQKKKLDKSPSLVILYWLKDVFVTLMWLFIPTYGLFLLMFLVAVFLFATLLPFLHLGKQHAAEQLEKGFITEPLMKATNPDGVEAEYRIVECSDRFCALYRQGKIVTVPLSSVNWAVSYVRRGPNEEE